MNFTKTLKALRGHPVVLQYGDPLRRVHEDIREGVCWDLFEDDQLTLLLTVNPNAEPPVPVMEPGDPPPARATGPNRTKTYSYTFRWLKTENIISVMHDTGITVDVGKRKLSKQAVPPIYTDNLRGWEQIDGRVRYNIERKLFELGYRDEEPTKPGATAQLVEGLAISPEPTPVVVVPAEPVPAPADAVVEVEAVTEGKSGDF